MLDSLRKKNHNIIFSILLLSTVASEIGLHKKTRGYRPRM